LLFNYGAYDQRARRSEVRNIRNRGMM